MSGELTLTYKKDDTNPLMVFKGDLGLNLDLSADFEIDGAAINSLAVTAASSGANDVLTPSSAIKKLKLYKVLYTCTSDITGEVKLLWDGAATNLGSILNPKAGGEYVLLSTTPHFVLGAAGVKLTINLPSATDSRIIAVYQET